MTSRLKNCNKKQMTCNLYLSHLRPIQLDSDGNWKVTFVDRVRQVWLAECFMKLSLLCGHHWMS